MPLALLLTQRCGWSASARSQSSSARVFSDASHFCCWVGGHPGGPKPVLARIDEADPAAGGGRSQCAQSIGCIRPRRGPRSALKVRETYHIGANASTNLRRPASTPELVWPQGRLAQANHPR